jgi:hypothetical protein
MQQTFDWPLLSRDHLAGEDARHVSYPGVGNRAVNALH